MSTPVNLLYGVLTSICLELQGDIMMIYYQLSSAAHAAFWGSGFKHSVGLHHAAVGEAAVVLIRIASPWKV